MKKLIILSLLLGNIAFGIPVKKISLLMSDKKDETILEKSFKTEAEKLGYKVNVYNAESVSIKQPSQIEAAIINATSAIVINPLDNYTTGKSLNLAISRKIPVITLSSSVNDVDVLAHITSDNKLGASHAAEWLVKKSPVTPKDLEAIIHLKGVKDDSVHLERYHGFKDYLLSKTAGPAWNKIPKTKGKYIELDGDFSEIKAKKLLTQQLKTLNPKAKYVIYSENDPMAIGCIEAIESNKNFNLKNFTIIGFDGSLEGKQMVDQKKMALTVAQDFEKMANEAATIMSNYLNDGVKPKNTVSVIKTTLYPKSLNSKN